MSVFEKTLRAYPVVQVNKIHVKPECRVPYTGLCFICKKEIDLPFAEITDMLSRKIEKSFCASKCLKKYLSKGLAKKIRAVARKELG